MLTDSSGSHGHDTGFLQVVLKESLWFLGEFCGFTFLFMANFYLQELVSKLWKILVGWPEERKTLQVLHSEKCVQYETPLSIFVAQESALIKYDCPNCKALSIFRFREQCIFHGNGNFRYKTRQIQRQKD